MAQSVLKFKGKRTFVRDQFDILIHNLKVCPPATSCQPVANYILSLATSGYMGIPDWS